ncbi:hypothetical protein PHMEG_00014788 [Phytophthora megakarya]|uniref:Uncharacterized protein n=1 Tax=Phytophthora megakarya TaxID=4795 RepID=A0A225W2W6_9STRA|nr:hypothetical protein PHMEG_00014788 [Phytophthora megakarya]
MNEVASDRFLGRVEARLPLNRPTFAALPPHSKANADSMVCPGICVTHSPYFHETLPPSHPLLSTTLFRNKTKLAKLSEYLVSGDSPWMTSTEIPLHVELYKQLQGVQQSIDKLPPVLLDGVSTLIERKAVVTGNITKNLLESTIKRLLKRAGLAQTAISEVPQPVLDQGSTMAHYYGGMFHMFPETFEFPMHMGRGSFGGSTTCQEATHH